MSRELATTEANGTLNPCRIHSPYCFRRSANPLSLNACVIDLISTTTPQHELKWHSDMVALNIDFLDRHRRVIDLKR